MPTVVRGRDEQPSTYHRGKIANDVPSLNVENVFTLMLGVTTYFQIVMPTQNYLILSVCMCLTILRRAF